MATNEVIRIDGDSDQMSAFDQLPWKIYGPQDKWVPPIRGRTIAELNLNQNLFFRHGDAQAFICKQGADVVGRVVASYDQNLLSDEKVGHFGYFETVHDPDVAESLLAAAEEWLDKRGVTVVHGPVNLNIFESFRVMVRGFETDPFLGEPRSPRYYRHVLEAAGYRLKTTWRSWDIPGAGLPMMAQILEGSLGKYDSTEVEDIVFQPFTPETFADDCRRIHDVVMQTHRESYGCCKMDSDEYVQVKQPEAFLANDESFMMMAPNQGPVGFCWAYYDYAQAFQEMNGDMSKWSVVENARPTRAVWHSIGILESHRQTGLINRAALQAANRCTSLGLQGVIGAFVEEGPSVYDSLGPAPRVYGLYEKTL